MRRSLTVALALVLFGAGAAAGSQTDWSRFAPVRGDGPTLVVKTRCLQAEDSAAALKLRSYDADRLVYGCSKRGY